MREGVRGVLVRIPVDLLARLTTEAQRRGLSRHSLILTRLSACPYGDPTCPCPDGLACHYQDSHGTPAMRPSRDTTAP